VALGAMGAHALQSRLEPRFLEIFETGVRYQFFHSLGLLVLALTALSRPRSRLLLAAGGFFLAGIVLFSGGLYCYVFFKTRFFAMVAPFGGTSYILGWFVLGFYGLRYLQTDGRSSSS